MEEIRGVPDVKNKHGKWMLSYLDINHQRYRTISGGRWKDIQKRCSESSNFIGRNGSYIGCKNGFNDFQEFVEWSMSQLGYDFRNPNGTLFHLDKDILAPGAKIYSERTCTFVSCRINSLITSCKSNKGLYPIGVSRRKNSNSYRAACRRDGGLIHLGCFADPMEAHMAWQKFKAEEIARVSAIEFNSGLLSEAAFLSLCKLSSRIASDAADGKETVIKESQHG